MLNIINNDNLIYFKQGFENNKWWKCTEIDKEFIQKLIKLLYNYPDVLHKIQYINERNEQCYLYGELIDHNLPPSIENIIITYYSYDKKIRNIFICKLPEHDGSLILKEQFKQLTS